MARRKSFPKIRNKNFVEEMALYTPVCVTTRLSLSIRPIRGFQVSGRRSVEMPQTAWKPRKRPEDDNNTTKKAKKNQKSSCRP